MRRRLILVFVAVSSLVATAFVVPLGFTVRRTAEDRAIDSARADSAAIVPALVSVGTRAGIEAAVDATRAGREGRVTVVTSQGWEIGAAVEPNERMRAALSSGSSSVGDTPGGIEVVSAVATGDGQLSAVRIFVSDAELHSGQWRAWGALAGVGVALVLISVFLADRLARTIVRPTEELADAARRLGDGQLDVAVSPSGPEELVELGDAFNTLGARISSMLDGERELVAELSHRLRTPLTKLRLRIDQVEDPALAEELGRDLNDVSSEVNALIKQARGLHDPSVSCRPAAVVRERTDYWRVLGEDQARDWRCDIGGDDVFVHLSETDLSAAVDVLIENVFAHTDDGVPVEIGVRRVDDLAEIWVGDGGVGFDADNVERGQSGSASTGLGLDIARRTAEQVQGELRVGTSRLGGAEVLLSLPVADRGRWPDQSKSSTRK